MNRTLGPSERMIWLWSQRWSINGVLAAQIRGPLSVPALTDALARVQRHHPPLSVRIDDTDRRAPRFVSEGTGPIPLRIAPRKDDEQWVAEVEAEAQAHFASQTGPLVRAVLLQGEGIAELLVAFHHAIGEGMSAVYLLRDILQEVASPGSLPEPLPERPSLQSLVPPAPPGNRPGGPGLGSAPPGEDTPAMEVQTRILPFQIPPDELTRLAARCREEQTSVQGALCAAFLLCAAEATSAPPGRPALCITPMNLRRHLLPPIGDEVGLYSVPAVTAHDASPGRDGWDLAREVRAQVTGALEQGALFDGIRAVSGFLASDPDPDTVYRAMRGMGFHVNVTNLGRLDIPHRYGPLSLSWVRGPLGLMLDNELLVSVATLGDTAHMALIYAEPVLPRALVERILDGARARLRRDFCALG